MAMLVANVLLICWRDPALPWPLTFSRPEVWSLLALNFVPVLLLHVVLRASWSMVVALHRRPRA